MAQFILLVHVLTAAFIIVLVLLQQGKGAAMGAAFGSGASQTVFGSRGSGSFLFKVTLSLIIIFFTTSIVLNYLTTIHYKQEKTISMPLPMKKAAPEESTTSMSVGRLPSVPTSAPVNEIPAHK